MLPLPVPVGAHVTDIKFLKTTNRYKTCGKRWRTTKFLASVKSKKLLYTAEVMTHLERVTMEKALSETRRESTETTL